VGFRFEVAGGALTARKVTLASIDDGEKALSARADADRRHEQFGPIPVTKKRYRQWRILAAMGRPQIALAARQALRMRGTIGVAACNLELSMTLLARFLLSCFLAGLLPSLAWAELTVGTTAPEFSTKAALGGKELTFALSKALKKGPVVVYFYP
jgi:hypothetical protein